ncbi:transposase [Patescibacteria group bacterium]
MPAKNVVKEYINDTYYHLYNRGINKNNIFEDASDYKTFLSYLKLYLAPIPTLLQDLQGETLKVSPSRKLNNYSDRINLLCYCLMPNHFHLLIFQKDSSGINYFMRSLGTKYSMYFNRKYKRVGTIFQGVYKAVRITKEEQLIYLSKYIHRNPLDILPSRRDLEGYKYSSYGNYLGRFKQSWVKSDEILSYFSKNNKLNSYKNFIEETDESDIFRIKELVLDI